MIVQYLDYPANGMILINDPYFLPKNFKELSFFRLKSLVIGIRQCHPKT